jgi:hypothetical protein
MKLDESSRLSLIALARGCDLVVVDSFDALLALMGFDSNNASGVRSAGTLLKQLAVVSGAAVLVVDHVTEKVEGIRQQLGSSAKKQFIDGTTLYARRLTRWKRGSLCRTMIEVGKERHSWVGSAALFEYESDEWGRAGMLQIQPRYPEGDGYQLDLLPPPTFESEPSVSSDELMRVQNQVLDFLRANARKNKWISQTAVFKALGDKNGRNLMFGRALEDLVRMTAIERREVDLSGGRTGIDYRYADLDAPGTDEGEN